MANENNVNKSLGTNDIEVSNVAGITVPNQLNRKRLLYTVDDDLAKKKSKMESPTKNQTVLASKINPYLLSDGDFVTSNHSSSSSSFKVLKPHQSGNESSSFRCDLTISNKENFKVPTNLHQLCEFMEDHEYMQQFSFEKNAGDRLRSFNIYNVNNDISYAAFHSDQIISQISDRSDCKIFFYYSEELRGQFHRMDVQFQGINHILMVFVNHKTDRITPFGFFLLPNKNKTILDDVIKVIDKWLNGNTSTVTTVVKCTTPYDLDLRNSIAKIFPTAKLIGCSDEFLKDIKLFAKRNKGHHETELTRLACTLCYLPQKYISSGIEIIENRSSSVYGTNLVQYLRTNWLGRLTSIFDEEIILRSVKVCKRFNKQIERDYFQSESVVRAAKKPMKNVWDFIEILTSLTKVSSVEMMLDGSTLERRRNRRFDFNTKLQKEKEARILSSMNEFKANIRIFSNNEAIEQFMIANVANI